MRLAGAPTTDSRFHSAAREINYRLRCATCGKFPNAPKDNSNDKAKPNAKK